MGRFDFFRTHCPDRPHVGPLDREAGGGHAPRELTDEVVMTTPKEG